MGSKGAYRTTVDTSVRGQVKWKGAATAAQPPRHSQPQRGLVAKSSPLLLSRAAAAYAEPALGGVWTPGLAPKGLRFAQVSVTNDYSCSLRLAKPWLLGAMSAVSFCVN